MKNYILRILRNGYIITKTQSLYKQLTKYLYVLKYIVKIKHIDGETIAITANNNAFWQTVNMGGRLDLINEVSHIHRAKPTDGAYFTILNRVANGDAFGIDTTNE